MDNLTAKAKQIVSEIIYVTLATSWKDNQPWNSPLYCAYDENYTFYWASDRNGTHSKNIRKNEKVFLVFHNSLAPEWTGKGVYFLAKAYEVNDVPEIEKAANLLAHRKGSKPRQAKEYLGEYPRRIYKAVPEKCWMNGEGSVNGNYIDTRVEVDFTLLQKKRGREWGLWGMER